MTTFELLSLFLSICTRIPGVCEFVALPPAAVNAAVLWRLEFFQC